MTKKTYQKPTLQVFDIQYQGQLLGANSISTTGLDSPNDLGYNKDGGDQGDAW